MVEMAGLVAGPIPGFAPGESPLVPYRTMRRMYAGMVESRMLEERLRVGRRSKGQSGRGQEACRISALIDLGPEDFASDVPGSVTTAYLRGAELGSLVGPGVLATAKKRAAAGGAGAAGLLPAAAGLLPAPAGVLPPVEDVADRFGVATGVALTLKRLKLAKVVVVFAEPAEVKTSLWRKTLQFAAREELPMLFVVLLDAVRTAGTGKAGKEAKRARPFALSAAATGIGVPGIPVDASDAVALYRVAQESIGRARAGGGPALMECVRFVLEGEKRAGQKKGADPIAAMGETLLGRKVCDERWLARVAAGFQARLDAV